MTSQQRRSYLWLFWSLALIGLAADQASKYSVFGALNDGTRRSNTFPIIPGAFNLTADYGERRVPVPDDWLRPLRAVSAEHMPTVNHGALWGVGGADEHGNHGNLFFSLISFAAAVAIVVWIRYSAARRDPLLCLSLGLILAGTLGNLYDRLVFDGVRDFLHWYYWIDWPVFNLADCCLVCGAALLLFQALFLQPQPARPTPAVVASEGPAAEVVDAR